MAKYIVNINAQNNGDHEVHRDDGSCDHMPNVENRKFLGYFDTCGPAVREAKKSYRQSNGCYYCCKPCHTT